MVVCGNTAQQCRLGLFQDSDFAGDFEDSKSTSGGIPCIFGSHTFVPIGWMCKKQTSVSHSSTEAEIISLDAGLRMDGIPALFLWDLVIEVFHSVPNRTDGPQREPRGNPSAVVKPIMHNPIPIKHTNVIPTNIDHIPPNTTHSSPSALLYVFEDNEAVIKIIIKGRSPTMRHVSRTHRVALDWLFDRINLDTKIQIRCIDTKHQLADILTKGNFTRDEWSNLLQFFYILHFSSTCCTKNFSMISCSTMAKRIQEQKEEERVVSKSRNSFDAASSSQVRLKDAYLGGLMEKQRRNPSHQEEEEDSEDSDNPEAEIWYCEGKQPFAHGASSSVDKESQDMQTLPPNIATQIPLYGSRLLHGQGNVWKKTPRSYERFGSEFGNLKNVHEQHSSSGSSRKRQRSEFKLLKESSLENCGTVFQGNRKAGQRSDRNRWQKHD